MSRRVRWIVALLVLVFSRPQADAAAQVLEPFHDLGTESLPFVGSSPGSLVSGTDRLYFAATTAGQGRQLWTSDGTAAGSHLVRASEGQLTFPSADLLTLSGERLYYGLNTPDYGHELWTSDGSAEGTRLVADLCPGECGGIAEIVPLAGERAVFRQQTSFFADTIWVSDGSAEGSFPLLGSLGGPSPSPKRLTALGDRVLFTARTEPDAATRLFVTDGTVDGTRRLGPELLPLTLFAVGNEAVFVAQPADGASELWITDGTEAGTRRLAVLAAAGEGTSPALLAATKTTDGLVLSIQRRTPITDGGRPLCSLWTSDGTASGTALAVDLSVEIPGEATACPVDLVPAGSRTFFVYFTLEAGQELAVSDGAPAGTRLLELHAGPAGTSIAALSALGDEVFFLGLDSPSGDPSAGRPALWASDGSLTGTRVVKIFGTPLASDGGEEIVTLGGKLYFSAAREALQRELWTSDGTTEGTRELIDLSEDGSQPRRVLHSAGRHRLFFTSPDAFGTLAADLWSTDGTEAGTYSVPPIGVASDPVWEQIVARGDRVFYQATDQLGLRGLWVSDGTPDGTLELSADAEPGELSGFGVGVCYAAEGVMPRNGIEPWCSDGTPGGTVLLGDLAPDPTAPSSRPGGWVQVGDRVVFQATTPATGRELWESDGTPKGTRPLPELAAGPEDAAIEALVAAGEDRALGLGYFRAGIGGAEELRVFELEGRPFRTAVGARLDALPFDRADAVFFRGRLLALLQRPQRAELWSSDGTELGTRLLRRIVTVNREPADIELTVSGNDLFFVIREQGFGGELWVSDGTGVGTRRVVDLIPGPEASNPHHLFAIPGGLLFSAWSRAEGEELWLTDGTAAGTRLVADLEPGPGSSSPEVLGAVATDTGSRLVVSAWREDLGFQLWRLEAAELGPRPCVERDGRFCLGGGRFEVLIDWLDRRTGASGRATGRANGQGSGSEVGEAWFFREDNLEVPVKILDGGAVNGHAWVFYATLTDLPFWLSVADLETGATRTYPHFFRSRCGGADVRAFEVGPGAFAPATLATLSSASQVLIETEPCADDPEALCFLDDRFRARVTWRDQRRPGREGTGTPVAGDGRTGSFWFFRPENLELYVKILDGRAVNGKFWVFYGSLTDVDFDLTVTDVVTGAMKTYHHPPGDLCGSSDTGAF